MSTTVNGLPVATALSRSKDWAFRLAAIRIGGTTFRLILAVRAGSGNLESIFQRTLDTVRQVTPEDAKEMARRCAREEGLLIGISSGAALAAVAQKLPELGDRPRVMTFNYDTGERYLSVPDFLPEEA